MINAINSIIRTYYDIVPEGQYLLENYDGSACLDMKELQIILKQISRIEMDIRWCIQAGRLVCVLGDDDGSLLDYTDQEAKVSQQDRKENKELEWLIIDERKISASYTVLQLEASYPNLKSCCFFMSAVNCRKEAAVGYRHAVEHTFLFYDNSAYVLLDEIYSRYTAFLDIIAAGAGRTLQRQMLEGVAEDIQTVIHNTQSIWDCRNEFLIEFRDFMFVYRSRLEGSGMHPEHYIEMQELEENFNRSHRNFWEEENCFCMLNRHAGEKLNLVISHIQRFMRYYGITGYGGLNKAGSLFTCEKLHYLNTPLEQVLQDNIVISKLQDYRRLMDISIK